MRCSIPLLFIFLFFLLACERERDPRQTTQKEIMNQIALAFKAYEKDYGETVPIKNLNVVKNILTGKNARSKVYLPNSPFADEYGRPYVIDKGQIVYRGEDGKLGTSDDIRVPEIK